ncbi:hypothetical protein XA68_17453 [Ophiocordyceps unilateralis]|uniref:Glucose-methanol-choline oxidoreductase N-terminal domain-containing protein n=1 Tax=Ophiocordyceps unilateralis TaxID=268505 RepID=A0A2A9PK40_OPHUN|nr:hypothetical protein XA68_17453 [Ophiocordyceps unilateralis]
MNLLAGLLLVNWLATPAFAGFIDAYDPSIKYDYVIVGSGAGGGPLGARLATYGYKVLIVEAGDDQTTTYHYQVPGLNLRASEHPPMAWNYYVSHYSDIERQKTDSKMTWTTPSGKDYVGPSPPHGSTPKGILYPRAGTFGGCTAHNAMITVYPGREDWDYIARTTGDPTWTADKMRAYFQRLERKKYPLGLPSGHGFTGWLTTSLTNLGFVVQDAKFEAMVLSAASAAGRGLGKLVSGVPGLAGVLGRDLNTDFPGRDHREGPFQIPLAIQNGYRSGPRDAIMPVLNSKNKDGSPKYHLDILFNTFVTRVLFDETRGPGTKQKAIGVEFIRGKSLYRADPRASQSGEAPRPTGNIMAPQIIISAGSFNTPQLLKLSGIGPRAELERWGISVRVDLPGVGTNMQDRYETTVVAENPSNFVLTEQCTWLNSLSDPCLQKWKSVSSTIFLRGGYTSNGIALGVLRKSSVTEKDSADLLISGAPAAFTGYFPGYSVNATKESKQWTWIVLKAQTRNRGGTVLLRSKNPLDTPSINFNYFDTGTNDKGEADLDAQALVEGMNWARQAVANNFRFPGFFREVWPGQQVKTDEEMKDWVKKEAWGHHACCTAPIGPSSDPKAVLDSKFRVRGVENLRVVDASIFPKIPGYFIVLPIYMISEKAADTIYVDDTASKPLEWTPRGSSDDLAQRKSDDRSPRQDSKERDTHDAEQQPADDFMDWPSRGSAEDLAHRLGMKQVPDQQSAQKPMQKDSPANILDWVPRGSAEDMAHRFGW